MDKKGAGQFYRPILTEYDSPIRLFFNNENTLKKTIEEHEHDLVFTAVCKVGIDIDKDTLMAAIRADRQRYENAFQKGVQAAREQIIHCRDCANFQVKDWWAKSKDGIPIPILAADQCPTCNAWGGGCKTNADGFCFLAKPREEGENDG